jgi:hypothetical protein
MVKTSKSKQAMGINSVVRHSGDLVAPEILIAACDKAFRNSPNLYENKSALCALCAV